MFSIKDLSVVVTGGASGIGRAIAERFSAAGAKITIADTTEASAFAGRIGGASVIADVSREADVVRALETARETFGRVDVLINNAGIQPLGVSLEATTEALLQQTFSVNVNSVVFGTKHAPRFLPRGGRVINTASFVGLIAAPGIGVYGASKAAVIHLTKIGAIELAKYGITVNCVCPGTVATPAVMDIPDNPEVAFIERTALAGRLAQPEEIAAAFHYLASPEAAYVTGHALAVDGGMTAGMTEMDLPEWPPAASPR